MTQYLSPEDKRVWNHIAGVLRRVVESYGYQEYGVPSAEFSEGLNLGGESAYPTRVYSIADSIRADSIGTHGPAADAEMIAMAYGCMMAFGVQGDMFAIHAKRRSSDEETQQLRMMLERLGVKDVHFDVPVDPDTGAVFEITDSHLDNNRVLVSGRRYGEPSIAVVGMATELSVIESFLRVHDLLPKIEPTTEIGIVVVDEDSLNGALSLARQFREEGVNTEVDSSGQAIDRQMKAFIKKELPFIVFVGEIELQQELFSLKDTITGDEERLSPERIVAHVKDRRRKQYDDSDDELFD